MMNDAWSPAIYGTGWRGRPAPPPAQVPQELVRFLNESMPMGAIAHSHHVDALADPAIGKEPTFQRFSLIELNELHHQVAALGAVLRMQQGDPTAFKSLGYNLAGFLQNRAAALEAARNLPEAVKQNPHVRRMMALIQQSNQRVQQMMPLLQEVIRRSGATGPGPLLVKGS